MRKFFFSRVMACAVSFVVLLAADSCVNSRYEISEEKMDLNVTVFQEGVSLPLGSTMPVSLGTILDKVGLREDLAKYLSTGADGAYSVYMTDTLDMSQELASLTDIIKLDAVKLEKSLDFSLENLDVSDIRIPEIDFPYEKKLSELVTLPAVNLPDFGSYDFPISSGLSGFNVDLGQLNKGLTDAVENISVRDTLSRIPAGYVPSFIPDEYRLDDLRDQGLIVNEVFEFKEPLKVVIDAVLPQNITDITDISFADNATMTIRATVEDCYFSSGQIDPTVDIDLSDLLHLVPKGEVYMDEIHEDMNLDAKAGSSVEKSYRLQSLVLNPGDITTVDGKLKLYKEVEITPVCTLHYKDVMVSKELMQAHNAVIIRLDIDFDNFVVDDITFDAQVEGLQAVQAVDFTTISPIQMPSQVDKIEYVDFADGSALCLDMSLQRPVNGLGMSLEYLELAFPATIKIAAGSGYELDQNKVIVRNCDMNNGLNLSINVENISLPEPVDGAVSIAEKILAKATISAAADDMKLSDLPESEADDLKIVISVTSDLKFEDCSFVLGKAGFPVDVVVGEINQALPSNVAGAAVIPVYLQGNPSLAIDVQMPDLKSILGPDTQYEIVPADNGFAVYFPDMIVFKEAVQNDGYYNYNLHALEYKTGFADVDFPIEKLQIVPQDGYAKGTVLAKGGVTLSGGNITYKQLQTVVNDPGAVVKIHASMSELIPSGMGAEMSSGRIEYALDMLDDIELPDMIDQVLNVELDDVKMFLDIDGSGIPRLGENERLNLKVKVSLPSFVLLDPEDPRVSNNILNLDISGKSQADKPGVSFEMAPVKIAGLDLSGVDFSSDNQHKVVLDATVKFDNVQLDNWVGKNHRLGINVEIKSDKPLAEGESAAIGIKSVRGKIGYSIDPVKKRLNLTEMAKVLKGDNLEATIDISRFYLALDVATNLGVSAKADLKIIPYYNGVPDEAEALVSEDEIVLPGASQSSDTLVTRFWVSNTDQGVPEGYKYINLDLPKLIRNLPEYIQFELSAGTDKDGECVFEPGAKYVLRAGYAAGLPLEFGEQFCVTYRDTLRGLPEEVAMLMDYGSLGLGGVIESNLPINVGLTMNLLDSHDNVIPMTDGVGRLAISSCTATGEPVKTPINLVVGKDKDTVISDIAAVEFVFTVDSKNAAGVPLREDSFIKVESLYALIPEGITLDLKGLESKIDESEEENN